LSGAADWAAAVPASASRRVATTVVFKADLFKDDEEASLHAGVAPRKPGRVLQ
jgi:hypothetical protein